MEVVVFLQNLLGSFSRDTSLDKIAKSIASYSFDISKKRLEASHDLARLNNIYKF